MAVVNGLDCVCVDITRRICLFLAVLGELFLIWLGMLASSFRACGSWLLVLLFVAEETPFSML